MQSEQKETQIYLQSLSLLIQTVELEYKKIIKGSYKTNPFETQEHGFFKYVKQIYQESLNPKTKLDGLQRDFHLSIDQKLLQQSLFILSPENTAKMLMENIEFDIFNQEFDIYSDNNPLIYPINMNQHPFVYMSHLILAKIPEQKPKIGLIGLCLLKKAYENTI